MRGQRRKRRNRDFVIGMALAAIGLLILILVGCEAYRLRSTKIELDAATNCPLKGPRAIHVIMIDRSDPITSAQAQRVRQELQRLKDGASFGTRFDVYTFEGDLKHELLPAISICAPGKPEDASELVESPARVRALYEDRFSKPLDAEVSALLTAQTRATSPILESLRGAAQTSFGSVSAGQMPLSLTLVSDLVQNSDKVSHFHATPNFDALSRSVAWPSLRPQLKGADVEVLYLLRPSAVRGRVPIQDRGHEAFWEQVIQAGGGTLSRIEPVVGDR